MAAPNALDPILAGALQMEEKPVIPARQFAQNEALMLVNSVERLGLHMSDTADTHGQLTHVCESLSVMIVALMAYARGLTPQVANQKPNSTIIVQ